MTACAVAQAAISGTSTCVLPVSSTAKKVAVSGARIVPPMVAAMASNAQKPGSAAGSAGRIRAIIWTIHMQARVPEPSRFLLIHAAAFRAAVDADPLLAHAVIGSLAQQFRRMVRQIKNLKLRTATQRVGCYLLSLSQRQHTPDKAILPFEKVLIASELGITRESFSRALSSLRNSGIRVHGQTIVIHDAPRLAAECGFDPVSDGPETGDFVV